MKHCHTCHQVHGEVACEYVAAIIWGALRGDLPVEFADQIQVEDCTNGVIRVAIILNGDVIK